MRRRTWIRRAGIVAIALSALALAGALGFAFGAGAALALRVFWVEPELPPQQCEPQASSGGVVVL